MNIFKTPDWVNKFIYNYEFYEEIPQEIVDKINQNLDRHSTPQPEISIVIPAFNEEFNLLCCIGSLRESATRIPFEIIVVNNNSTDNTQKLLDRLKIRNFFEKKVGRGKTIGTGKSTWRIYFNG